MKLKYLNKEINRWNGEGNYSFWDLLKNEFIDWLWYFNLIED